VGIDIRIIDIQMGGRIIDPEESLGLVPNRRLRTVGLQRSGEVSSLGGCNLVLHHLSLLIIQFRNGRLQITSF
jgi:hypothetical protein